MLKAKSNGFSELTANATVEGVPLSGSVEMGASKKVLTAVKLEGTTVLIKGKTQQLKAKAIYSDETEADIDLSKIRFKSLDDKIVTVDDGGVVTGTESGSTVVFGSYTEDGVTKTGRMVYSVRSAARVPTEEQSGTDSDDYYGITISEAKGNIGSTDGGDWVMYGGFDFGSKSYSKVVFSVGTPQSYAGSPIYVRLDSRNGPVIATLTVEATDGFNVPKEQVANIVSTEPITGVHDIYLTFAKTGTGNVFWFKFI